MRPNLPFHNLDLSDQTGFVQVGEGVYEKILADSLDHEAKTGHRTRLLKLEAGRQNLHPHAHEFWEELYIIEGSLLEGAQETGETRFSAPAYACREPGFMHGPNRSDEACLMIEFNWYGER